MGFGDKFKNLTQQAKEKVAENRERIQEAVDAATVTANEKTHGKYADRLSKVSEKTGSTLDRIGGSGDEAPPAPASAEAPRFSDEVPKFDGE
ncbi:MAG: Rv0909 family putative TA system antitoxin [Solirubrobacteraceae bacterium]